MPASQPSFANHQLAEHPAKDHPSGDQPAGPGETGGRPGGDSPERIAPAHFDYLRALAHFEGAWKWCARAECNRRRKCCGGPRGTATRRAIPACRSGEPGEEWAAEQIALLAQTRQASHAETMPQSCVGEDTAGAGRR